MNLGLPTYRVIHKAVVIKLKGVNHPLTNQV